MALPGMISLGGGLPNPSMFPFTMMNVTLADGSTISLAGQLLSDALQYSNSVRLTLHVEYLDISNPGKIMISSECLSSLSG
jgi:kynurenine/2-aminoadipate aminotransferase